MDSPSRHSDTLNYIVQFLHTNGLYAAENALVRELENRYPELEASSPTESAPVQPFLASPEVPTHVNITFDASTIAQQDENAIQEHSGRQAVQDRRVEQQDHSGAQRYSSSSQSPGQPAETPAWGRADRRRVTEDDCDEYEDEEDPGYIREDIRGQDAFVARELDVSDADGSRRAMDLYHQAMDAPAQQDWAQGHGDDERSSSDGRGSSYFSGERLDHIHSPMHSQQSLSGHGESISLAERTVVLAEPVYPADSPARSTHSASRAGSTSGDLGCVVGMPSVPSTLGAAHESQRPAADRQRQASDAAANRAAAIAVAASSGASYASGASGRSSGQMNASLLSSSAPEASSRSFLDPLGIVEKVSDVFSRRVQPRSESETSKHSTTTFTDPPAFKASKQAPSHTLHAAPDAEAETVATLVAQRPEQEQQQGSEGMPGAVDGSMLRVKAPEPAKPIRTASGASRTSAKASGSLDPASPSGVSEEDENFSFPLTPPSEPAAPAAVFSSWHSFRKRSSKGYDTDDDLSMGRVSDFSVEPSQESNPGLSHNSTETQHTLLKAAGRLDSANSADPSEGQSKAGADPQSCSHEADHPLTIPDFAVEPQPSLHSEASLARQITLGKGDLPVDGSTCPQQPFAEATEDTPLNCHAAGSGSAEGTEMLSMGLRAGRHLAAGAPVCSSLPCKAWPSILLQPQDASLPAQAPSQASLQLPDASSEPPPETPHFPPHAPAGLDDRPPLLPEPFGSSVMHRPSEDTQPLPAPDAARETASTVVQQAEVPVLPGRGPATDMLATPSRLSRASSAMATESSSQAAMPPTPTSIAAECSSPPSLAAVYSGRDDGRAAGMRGIASSSMTSLDGKGAASSYRDREAAAKARASLDFSSLSERAAKGTRPLPHQRAKSADIPASSQHKHHQMLPAVRPLDVSQSLSQHELINLHKGALQKRKPPPLPPQPDDTPSQQTAAGRHAVPAGHKRVQGSGHPLAGGSPAASVAVLSGGAYAAGEATSDCGVAYEYDPEYIDRKYEIMELKVIHRRRRTGFEETKDFPIRVDDLIAGRYQVMDFLGSAAFSRAVQALDVKTQQLVCLKIIKNNKDYFDQSLDEIKLLRLINAADPDDQHGLLRLYDYFYYKEHLFLVCELLRANLYEFQKYNRDSVNPPYFVLQRVQSIARQVLTSLAFLHSLGLIHSDLKPENILIKSYSRCEVKVIDFGSSCFTTDQLSSYVQSRSYRAPEVILGLPYGQKVDVWSLGCILAELLSGYVLFQNDSLATLLARLEGILGPVPQRLLAQGRYTHRYYTVSGALFERNPRTHCYEYLHPKQTSIGKRVPEADEGCRDFLLYLLTVDPQERPTAELALQHPWLQQRYPPPPVH